MLLSATALSFLAMMHLQLAETAATLFTIAL
jgi:hypothetical protein